MLVSVENVSKRFGPTWVLRDVSLSLEQGEVVGLLGANGSGKTTLLRLIAGLIKPTKGSVKTLEQACFMANPPTFHKNINGLEALRFGELLEGNKVPSNLILGALERVELSPQKRIGVYSSGMRKRLALAQLMLRSPAVVLMDEPESALDVAGKAILREAIQAFAKSGGVVIATHDQAFAAEVCTRIVEMGAISK